MKQNTMSHVLSKLEVNLETGCWESVLCPSRGYTTVRWYGVSYLMHRLLYTYLIGDIPDGLQLDHLCRNRKCANPYHLEPVTPGENTRRSPIHDGVLNSLKTHCKRGHLFSKENTILSPWKGKIRRNCKTCHANSVRLRRVKIRDAFKS